ncbi:hypothetical protein [Ulvibacterium sp.]|uniref:hypothetical protein n=1 Tax=Ulvibacterium sp. TaxID=2665914 RepID=UPI002616CB43|nr:hypothetical protein [Ulvibacterium sp.]
MDNFEKHIRENKALFDEHKADKAKLWANIASDLEEPGPKVVPLWRSPLIRVAAGVLLLFGIAGITGVFLMKKADYNMQETIVSQELLDIDMHYKSLVSYQVQLVKDNPKLSDGDKEEFLLFMDELDKEYELLKLEMKKNLDNERILEAIIANYKKRIELIENLLHQINDSKITNEDYDGYIL